MQDFKKQLITAFKSKIVLTLEDFKDILQTSSRMTIYRKLKTLQYSTSYSHSGRYYTLNEFANYNRKGIWSYHKIYFSKFGTLKNTVLISISKSPNGFTSNELEKHLNVPVLNTLTGLYKNGTIKREQIGIHFVYLSTEHGEEQIDNRKKAIVKNITYSPGSTQASDELFTLFFSTLNEKQRRLFAGYESIKLGYGGDKAIALKTGLNRKTVSQGRRELLNKDINIDRIREQGAGRPSLKKTKKF